MAKKVLSIVLAMGISFGLMGCGANDSKSYEASYGTAEAYSEEEVYDGFNGSLEEGPGSWGGEEGSQDSLYGPFSVIQIGKSVRADFSALAGTYEMTTLSAKESAEVTIHYEYKGKGGEVKVVLIMPDGITENILTRSDGAGQFSETGSQVFNLPEGESVIWLEAIDGKAGKITLDIEGEVTMATSDHSETNLLNWNLTF